MITILSCLRIAISIVGVCCLWIPNRVKVKNLTPSQIRFILFILFLVLFVAHDFIWMATNLTEVSGAAIASNITMFFVSLLGLVLHFDPWHSPQLRSRSAVVFPLIVLLTVVGVGLFGLLILPEQNEPKELLSINSYPLIDIIGQIGLLFGGGILLVLFRGPSLDK